MNRLDYESAKKSLIAGAQTVNFEEIKIDKEIEQKIKKINDSFLKDLEKISRNISANTILPKNTGYINKNSWGDNLVPEYNIGRAEIFESIYKKIIDKVKFSPEEVDIEKELLEAETKIQKINEHYKELENLVKNGKIKTGTGEKINYGEEFKKKDDEIKKIMNLEVEGKVETKEEKPETGTVIKPVEPIENDTINDERDTQNKNTRSFINDPNWDKNKVFKNKKEFEKAKKELYENSADKLFKNIRDHEPEKQTEQEILQKQMDQKMKIADELMKAKIQEEEDKENKNNGLEKFDSLLDDYLKISNERKQLEKEVDVLKSLLKKIKPESEKDYNEAENKTEEISENIDDIVEILKNNKIDQIIVSGGNYNEEKDTPRFNPDLDTRASLYLLNYLNKKPLEETYNEGAISSPIGKKGEGIDKIENKNGVRIFLDTGGEWIKVIKNGEEKTIYIDHHGSGKREPTSGTKMMYEIMKKAEILEEKPWVKDFVELVNDIDNLSYVDEKDKNGHRLFTENYLKNYWPQSLRALAEDNVPLETLVKLFESGKIKDYKKPFTDEEMAGELGDLEVKINGGTAPLREAVKDIRTKLNENIEAVKRARSFDKNKEKLNLDSKILGKVLYHNFKCFYKVKNQETGKEEPVRNTIDNKMAFKIMKAMNMDTLITWDKKNNKFFINSTTADLVEVTKRLNKLYLGGATEIRGVFIVGKIGDIKEKQFLETLDPEIVKDVKKNENKG